MTRAGACLHGLAGGATRSSSRCEKSRHNRSCSCLYPGISSNATRSGPTLRHDRGRLAAWSTRSSPTATRSRRIDDFDRCRWNGKADRRSLAARRTRSGTNPATATARRRPRRHAGRVALQYDELQASSATGARPPDLTAARQGAREAGATVAPTAARCYPGRVEGVRESATPATATTDAGHARDEIGWSLSRPGSSTSSRCS